jgi:hypothetical protein
MKRERTKWPQREITALKVCQWLEEWDKVSFDVKSFRKKPDNCFYQFSISAAELKALSGIYPRTTKERKSATEDLGIQRRHEKDRSDQIHDFIRYGYPWSDLSKSKRESGEFDDLRKPGWLPTAIVVNILKPGDERYGRCVDRSDLVTMQANGEDAVSLQLPKNFSGAIWRPKAVPPIEVIDGQHRLWAFEDYKIKGEFQLPVVAFHGLDISWQAYLFYVINIKPKKINASLAFDLYPLLRTEDWLEKFEGHIVYRETRAQELVDLLWSHPKSPWHKRINMLGEPGFKGQMVSQSAWIRSLLASYIKSWEGPGVRIGGLFGAPVGTHKQTLPWSRLEQAALLIVMGEYLRGSVSDCSEKWARDLRKTKQPTLFQPDDDLAFYGQHTLLSQDQGIRVFLQVTNDFCYLNADKLGLEKWGGRGNLDGDDEHKVTHSIKSLQDRSTLASFFEETCVALAKYDWRASSAPTLTENEKAQKAAFRGSGGYRELRRSILRHLEKESGVVGRLAKQVLKAIGY